MVVNKWYEHTVDFRSNKLQARQGGKWNEAEKILDGPDWF